MNRLSAIVIALGLAGEAGATEAAGVPRHGLLHPGEWTEVLVAAVRDGAPVVARPDLSCDQAAVEAHVADAPIGVTSWWVRPDTQPGTLTCRAAWGSELAVFSMTVRPAPDHRLMVPGRTDALSTDTRVPLLIRGEGLDPESLQVVTSEGAVGAVRQTEEGLQVDILPDEDSTPRVMTVGVRDRRAHAHPVWARIHLRASLDYTVRTEVGARISVAVGRRTYGPVVMGDTGEATLKIEQYPGETGGEIEVQDSVGNITRRSFEMATRRRPRLLSFVSGPRYPGETPPAVWLRATSDLGENRDSVTPVCRTPRLGELSLVDLGSGNWLLQLPPIDASDAWEVRIRCTLGDLTTESLSVPLADGVPVGMQFRVWPRVLSADFPLADVAVSLYNDVGERVPISGKVDLGADYGSFERIQRSGPVLRAEYLGDMAAEVGEDHLVATWDPAPGEGGVDHLEASIIDARSNRATVAVRALDSLRRPLGGVEVRLDGLDGALVTDEEGWASGEVPATDGLVSVRASTEHRETRAIAVAGTEWDGGPGKATLEGRTFLNVDPGRVADVDIELDPPRIRTGFGLAARSTVVVRFLDRTGLGVEDPTPEITVDAGRLVRLSGSDALAHRYRYIAPRSFRERDVELTARSSVLDVSGTSMIKVRASPTRYLLGVSAGVHSNLAALNTGRLDLVSEFRISVGDRALTDRPAGPSRFMARVGVGWFAATREATFPEAKADVRVNFFPVNFGFLLRQEYPIHAFWVGGVGSIVPYTSRATYDTGLSVRGAEVLPGLGAVAGYAIRIPSGELGIELTGTIVPSTADGIGFSGSIGGVSAQATWRVLWF